MQTEAQSENKISGNGHPESNGHSMHVDTYYDTIFSWVYKPERENLRRLYEMAKRDQWNATNTLAWDTNVDLEDPKGFPPYQVPIYGSDIWNKLTLKEQHNLTVSSGAWVMSQFLHGEQGALLVTAQIVSTVPWMDAKLYASTQVVDEGRHVEVFDHYLREKIRKVYPINPHLSKLLNLIVTDARWDMKYLGMQILVEGLALGAFGMVLQVTEEPLLKSLLTYVMKDEARHVAFGALSLKEIYPDMPEGERKDREDFSYEACVMMRDRFLAEDVWIEHGLPKDECCRYTLESLPMIEFRKLLFSRVMPNLKRLGLLPGRLRPHYEELGILQYENFIPEDQDAVTEMCSQ